MRNCHALRIRETLTLMGGPAAYFLFVPAEGEWEESPLTSCLILGSPPRGCLLSFLLFYISQDRLNFDLVWWGRACPT